jgi:hypothetical protein
MPEPLHDHISDDGRTSLCGLTEEQLPEAPLCPACVALERRLRPGETLRMAGVGMVGRAEQAARQR